MPSHTGDGNARETDEHENTTTTKCNYFSSTLHGKRWPEASRTLSQRSPVYQRGSRPLNICPVHRKAFHLRLHVLINNSWGTLSVTFHIVPSWGERERRWNCISFCKAKTAPSAASSTICSLERRARSPIVQFGTKGGRSYWKAHASESAKITGQESTTFPTPHFNTVLKPSTLLKNPGVKYDPLPTPRPFPS